MFRLFLLLFCIVNITTVFSENISSYGKEFVFAIPPNDAENTSATLNVLMLYITAIEKSNVQVTYNGKTEYYTINANSTKEIELKNLIRPSNNKYGQEVYETGVVKDKTFRIESDSDIAVAVLNSKEMTADSFIIFPTKAWGKNYIHLAYWDNEIYGGHHKGSGMLIIANYDNTVLNIYYKGINGTKTTEGKKIGDKETITLNKGEVYSFRSTGIGEFDFDLSGTQVISSKPVGAISFHQRTSIPGGEYIDGKDHLVEMITPVTAWGDKYVCLQLARDNVNGWFSKKWGDYFRGIASENGTVVTCKYYNFETGELYDQLKFEIDANEYFEYNGKKGLDLNNKSIRGISIWESNKPFMLMQYCYSADWDRNDDYDPFMTLAVPTEQYVNYTVFNVPGKSSGIESSFANILVSASTDNKDILKTMRIDGLRLSDLYPELLLNKVPGENLYWLRLPISQGNHIIESDALFGAYLYGFGNYISYGHTTSQGFDPINNDGAPIISYTEVGCGEYWVTVTDSTGIQSLEFENVNNLSYDTTGFYTQIDSFRYEFPIYVDDVDLIGGVTINAIDLLGYSGSLYFTFPEEEMKYYNVDLTATKQLFETNDSLSAEIRLNSKHWALYPLDNFEIEIMFDPAKYSFLQFNSSLGEDFLVTTLETDSVSDISKYIVRFEALSDTTFLNTDTLLGTINLGFRWNNDLQPSFRVDMSELPYSSRCIRSLEDTVITPVRMCAPDLFAIQVGEKYNVSKISPNPVTNSISFSVTVPYNTNGKIALYDAQGNIVTNIHSGAISKGKTEYNTNLEDYPAGIYFLKVKAGLLDSNQKIIKVE